MGTRGPLPNHTYGAKTGPKPDPVRQQLLHGKRTAKPTTKRATKAIVAIRSAATTAPAVPEHFGVVGGAVWRDLWESMPILSPRIDGHSVTRYCEAADDASRARAEVEKRGLIIDEVMADPRGGILGYKATLNPAEAALRRADKVLTELGDRLGLTPAARARLGLTINQAELAGAEAGRILSSMFRSPVIDMEEEQ